MKSRADILLFPVIQISYRDKFFDAAMKKTREISLITILIIVIAFIMAAAIILSCIKLPGLKEILKYWLSVIEY